AEHRRGQHQWKADGGVQDFLTTEVAVREDVGDPNADGDREGGGERRHAQAEPEREPVDGGHAVRGQYSAYTAVGAAVAEGGWLSTIKPRADDSSSPV